MLKITNGKSVFEVTNGAYENIYKKQGYKVVGEKTEAKKVTKKEETPKSLEVTHKVNDDLEEETEEDNDDELNLSDEDKLWIEEVEEKPIAQWSKEDAKRYTNLMQLDTTGHSKFEDVKKLIKEFIESK